MTAKDKEALLSSKLFAALLTDFLDKKAKIVCAEKGEALMSEKSFDRCLVLIIKGSAAVIKSSLEGKTTVINRLYEGDIFGMATLFYEEAKFPSTIKAEKALRCAVFSKEDIEEAFCASPEFAKAYATLLSEKIHFLNKKLANFSEGEVPEKLLRWILSTAEGKSEIELGCSLAALAQNLGMGRASIYRAFDSLIERGIIAKDGKKIVILKQ